MNDKIKLNNQSLKSFNTLPKKNINNKTTLTRYVEAGSAS